MDWEQVGRQEDVASEAASCLSLGEPHQSDKAECEPIRQEDENMLRSLVGENNKVGDESDIDLDEIFGDASESASEESSSEEKQTEELEVERHRNVVLQQFESTSGFFINNKTAVLHRKKTAMTFACGRKISVVHTLPSMNSMDFVAGSVSTSNFQRLTY